MMEIMVGEIELLIRESSPEATWMFFQAPVMVAKNLVLMVSEMMVSLASMMALKVLVFPVQAMVEELSASSNSSKSKAKASEMLA